MSLQEVLGDLNVESFGSLRSVSGGIMRIQGSLYGFRGLSWNITGIQEASGRFKGFTGRFSDVLRGLRKVSEDLRLF